MDSYFGARVPNRVMEDGNDWSRPHPLRWGRGPLWTEEPGLGIFDPQPFVDPCRRPGLAPGARLGRLWQGLRRTYGQEAYFRN